MKENPADQPIRDRLEPGHISVKGFLGTDDRPLADIIAADTGAVEAEGLSVKQLGDFLEKLHVTGDGGWESRVPMYDGKISVRSDETLDVHLSLLNQTIRLQQLDLQYMLLRF